MQWKEFTEELPKYGQYIVVNFGKNYKRSGHYQGRNEKPVMSASGERYDIVGVKNSLPLTHDGEHIWFVEGFSVPLTKDVKYIVID